MRSEVFRIKKMLIHKYENVLCQKFTIFCGIFHFKHILNWNIQKQDILAEDYKWLIIDSFCPNNTRIAQTGEEKLINDNTLIFEFACLCKLKKFPKLPVMIGALVTMAERMST